MKKIIFSSAVMALLFINSCTKTINNTTPVSTGTLTGFVTTLDQYGYRVAADASGVTISLNNGASATTDANGKYEFDSLKSGNYTATYSKAGYGTNMAIDFNFIGGGTTIRSTSISRIPSFQLYGVTDSTTTTGNNGPGVFVKGIDTADNNARALAVFIGSNSLVSFAPASFLVADVAGVIKAGQGTFSTFISSRVFYDAGLPSGSTAYLAVYPISATTTSYADPATGKNVYTSVSASPSATLSVIVP